MSSTDLMPVCGHMRLTRREASVLRWLVEGKRDAEVAAILGVSVSTVRACGWRVRRKLGAPNRARLIAASVFPSAACSEAWGLSARERDVIRCASAGCTDAEIAGELGVAVRTISKHMEHVLQKLHAESRYVAITMLDRANRQFAGQRPSG